MDVNVRYVRTAIYVRLSHDISVLVYGGQYAGPINASSRRIMAPGAPPRAICHDPEGFTTLWSSKVFTIISGRYPVRVADAT